ncbi:DegT/DnrJ/EryC1/StrS family aminotransferase [Ascidiimonas aurantiaca]|uniref:DegT/DnrJ/EryC1/StrS family aminotransferase n=1 Tax=Ascidiimonas aurantiaca TaxID=1685432 RepID=UPI0030EF7F26
MPGFELFGDLERKHVNDVLDSGVLMRYGFDSMRNDHWKARELETLLAHKMQVDHAHVVSSGTAALTVALASMGVGAGDEVIVPSFTFVASFEAVIALGAVPVITNIDKTLTLDPQAVKNAITPRTKVVMPVHMCGSMARLNELQALCKEHDLFLLEDACQAIGGTYQGKPLGSYGDAGCFSFDYVKTVTCGEGGALITNHKEIYEKAHMFSDHGHDHIGSDRGAEQHPFLGYNFRISELNAAVGLAQLQRLDSFLELQKKNYYILKSALQSVEAVVFREVPEGGEESYAFLNFFMPDAHSARQAVKFLAANKVDGCFYWFSNNWHYVRKWEHLQKLTALGALPRELKERFFHSFSNNFGPSDYWMERNISVLIKLSWSEEEVARRAAGLKDSVLKALKN